MPTMDVLHLRHMSDTHRCLLCGREDSWRHALLECTMSRCVWALSEDELVQLLSMNTNPNAKHWLLEMHDQLTHERFVLLVVTLWATWRARRKAIYEGVFQSPEGTNQFIKSYIVDLQTIAAVGSGQEQHQAARPSHWIAPPDTYAKINVDAATATNRGVAAAICRDQAGIFQGASALVIKGTNDPPTLEALAVREALALADDLNIRMIHVASDCKVVVDDIKNKTPAIYGAILHEIIDHSSTFISCTFVHEFRSSNFEAHNLAKHSLNLGVGRHVWLGNPGNLSFVPLNIGTS